MSKPKFDYNKITLPEMVDYVIENGLTDKIDLLSFEEETEEYKLVNVLEADGKPKQYIDKNGKTRIKKKQIGIGKKTTKYNFLKAKREFYKVTKEDIDWTNPPKTKSEKESQKATSALDKLRNLK